VGPAAMCPAFADPALLAPAPSTGSAGALPPPGHRCRGAADHDVGGAV